MGVVHTQESGYAKEMRRHEAHHSAFGTPGRPYVYREFPKMLYKATRDRERGPVIDQTVIVNDDDEQRRQEAKGFATTQERAMDLLAREHREDGIAAAARNFEIAHGRISPAAAAEVRAAEAEHGARHLAEVKEKPRRRRRTQAQIAADHAAKRRAQEATE